MAPPQITQDVTVDFGGTSRFQACAGTSRVACRFQSMRQSGFRSDGTACGSMTARHLRGVPQSEMRLLGFVVAADTFGSAEPNVL
jgi:hypothetical protein